MSTISPQQPQNKITHFSKKQAQAANLPQQPQNHLRPKQTSPKLQTPEKKFENQTSQTRQFPLTETKQPQNKLS